MTEEFSAASMFKMTEVEDTTPDAEYRVPKRQISVEVTLHSQPWECVGLHLGDRAERHNGPERPSDVLNGATDFLPVTAFGSGISFLRKDAILVMSVPAEVEPELSVPGLPASSPEGPRSEDVEIRLEDGTRLRGQITHYLPAGQRRLQDFLNRAPEFFPLRDGQTVHLVNRSHVNRVMPL